MLLGASMIAAECGFGETARADQVLFSFTNLRGAFPVAPLISGGTGIFYGTTYQGGAFDKGVVFKLSSPAPGQVASLETVLFSFNGSDGAYPEAGLVADGAGNLYGAAGGGTNGGGVVFELSPPAPGQTAWTETVLYSFSGNDGANPLAGLIKDGAGNLYGTTERGGPNNLGLVFELSPPAPGQTAWTETVLFSFDGYFSGPTAGLIADGAGNLFGTTARGGEFDDGQAFELSPPAPGQTVWTETVLFSFSGGDGAGPYTGLLADGAGNFFGTTTDGGAGRKGVVFELSPPAPGQTAWTETLFSFRGRARGEIPNGLIRDCAGELVGTTDYGGAYGMGTVFRLRLNSDPLHPLSQGATSRTGKQKSFPP